MHSTSWLIHSSNHAIVFTSPNLCTLASSPRKARASRREAKQSRDWRDEAVEVK